MKSVSEIVRLGPVIPVLAFESVEQGENVSRALHAGGVKVLEITLRTAAGLEAIERASHLSDDIVVGVGTITKPEHCAQAKKAGAQFLSMDEEVLQRDELDYLIQRLQHTSFPSDEDMEEARWLRNYIGKTGFIQLGWPHQGIMFLFEVTTEWYERYQHLLDLVEDFGTMAIDDSDQDDER